MFLVSTIPEHRKERNRFCSGSVPAITKETLKFFPLTKQSDCNVPVRYGRKLSLKWCLNHQFRSRIIYSVNIVYRQLNKIL